MFLDASAIVAILMREADWEELESKAELAKLRLTSALAVYETVLGIARILRCEPEQAKVAADGFLAEAGVTLVTIDHVIGFNAISAHSQFGRGRHKAALNMGDCFSYACAKVHKVPLLCKGNDFVHTDIQIA